MDHSKSRFLMRRWFTYRRAAILFCLLFVGIVVLLISDLQQQANELCYVNNRKYDGVNDFWSQRPLPDALLAKPTPPPGRSIFFVDTRCPVQPYCMWRPTLPFTDHHTDEQPLALTLTQACAIEAAALHNSHMSIYVLFAHLTIYDDESVQPHVRALLTYENVHLRHFDVIKAVRGIPAYSNAFAEPKDVPQDSKFMAQYITYLALWHWGGMTIDYDTLVLKGLESLPENFFTTQFTGSTGYTFIPNILGILSTHKDRKLANYLLAQMDKLLRDTKDTKHSKLWTAHLQSMLLVMVEKFCYAPDIRNLIAKPEQCKNLHVFAPSFVDHLPAQMDIVGSMDSAKIRSVLQEMSRNQTYMLHLDWLKREPLFSALKEFNTRSIYGHLGNLHCPRVFSTSYELSVNADD